jgi:hypothetical protein
MLLSYKLKKKLTYATKKPLEPINSIKFQGTKSKHKNQLCLNYTTIDYTKEEMKKINHFIKALNRTKYLVMDLTTKVKDMDAENSKTTCKRLMDQKDQ